MEDEAVSVKNSQSKPENNSRKTYVSNIFKQILLNFTYMTLAFVTCIRGPTLIDMQEIYNTTLETLSFSLAAASIGGIFGSMFFGYVWGKYHPYKHFQVFLINFFISLAVGCQTYGVYIIALFAMIGVQGFCAAMMHTAANVLCLEIWRGFNGSPYMHSMHFSYSVGAVLSPFISKPFLSDPFAHMNNTVANQTNFTNEYDNGTIANHTPTKIHILYPMSGMIVLLVATGYIFLGVRDILKLKRLRRAHKNDPSLAPIPRPSHPSLLSYSRNEKILIALMFLFLMIYVGVEFSIINYLPPFAVKCQLHLNKAEGANLLALYLAPYAVVRVLAVFMAMKLKPGHIMMFNGFFISVGCIIFMITADTSHLYLQIGYLCYGIGMGCNFANTFMWVEQYIAVTSKIAGFMSVGAGIGVNIAPFLIGQLINDLPMILIYLQVVAFFLSAVIFLIGNWIGKKILLEKDNIMKTKDLHLTEKLNGKDAMSSDD